MTGTYFLGNLLGDTPEFRPLSSDYWYSASDTYYISSEGAEVSSSVTEVPYILISFADIQIVISVFSSSLTAFTLELMPDEYHARKQDAVFKSRQIVDIRYVFDVIVPNECCASLGSCRA